MKKTKLSFLFAALSVMLLFSLSLSAFAVSNPPVPEKPEITREATELTFRWKSIKGFTGYQIFSVSQDGKKTYLKSTRKLECTVTDLKPNTKYSFVFRSYFKSEDGKAIQYSDFTATVNTKTRPTPVSGLKFVKATSTSVTVSWKAVKGATSYRVVYYTGKDTQCKEAGITKNTQFTIKNLSGKNYYRIKVGARIETNNSRYTPSLKLYTVPAAPSKPVISKTDSTKIVLSWTKNPLATKYKVYAASSADGKYKLLTSTSKTTYTYKVNKPLTTYYFKIRVCIETANQKLNSPLSAAAKGKTANITATVSTTSPYKGEYIKLSVPGYSNAKWTSSNSKILSVTGKRAFAAEKGTATLTATYGSAKASVKVTVGNTLVSYKSCVYDVTNGCWLYRNAANQKCYPGSITKLVTALVSSKYISPDKVLTVGSELNLLEGAASRSGIYQGEKFTYKDLLYAMLLPSGCDAAYTIAVNCARIASGNPNMSVYNAKTYFVSMMNDYMKSIGATASHFVNPHGYPYSNHYTTANDLCLVGRQVLKNSLLKSITSTYSKTVTAVTGKTHTFTTTNSMINPYSGYYSPYAHGLKTGTTSDNYCNLMTAATKDGHTIITVVIGCESYASRYTSTRRMYSRFL
ncbi:MAG: fibronectin type III domain-containing protein [Acutalibacteraceae bacterium]